MAAKKLNSRERSIVTLTLALLGLFIADRLIWSPVAEAWQRLDGTVVQKRSQLAHDRRLLVEQERVKREFASYALPASEVPEGGSRGATGLLRSIEALARQSGVKISDIKPQRTEGGSTRSGSVSLWIESDWDSLARFVYRIQNSSQRLQLEKARLQRKGDESGRVIAQFQINES
jgi:type II secretory pathway component PulM